MNSLYFVIYCMLSFNLVSATWNFAGKNVALGRNTVQSNTWSIYSSDLAVDGNTDANFYGGRSCTHTNYQYNTKATWTVHLSKLYTLKGIRIFNRNDYRYRLENFKIIGLPSSTTLHNDRTASPQLYNNLQIDVVISSQRQFSSITIEIPAHTGTRDYGASYLTLCEVQIYTEDHDCVVPASAGHLRSLVRQGTGYINPAKGLVSTGTILDFSCTGHYTLAGSTSTTCLQSQQYNTPIPTCVEIQCNKPTNFINGYYTQVLRPRYSVDETVTWECAQGYTSKQSRTRQCLVSTSWSGNQPVCTRIECFFPGHFPNGVLKSEHGANYTFGKVGSGIAVLVKCVEGFKANISELNCTEEGQWDGVPLCIPIQCGRPDKLIGGHYNYTLNDHTEENGKDVYEYGTEASAVCNETLFRPSLENETSRICGQNGTWTGHKDLCDALCEAPSLPNGFFSGQKELEFYEVGHSLTPVCLEGFALDGEVQSAILCQQNHTWDPPVPVCIETRDASQSILMPAAVGGGVGVAVLIMAGLAIVMFVVIRRRRAKENRSDTSSNTEPIPVPNEPKNAYNDGNIYEINEYTPDDHREPYYNLVDINKIPMNAIKIEKLTDLVLAPDSTTGRFQKEFEAFPEGMTKQHTHASHNMRRNRYRGLYAYDDSRVALTIWDKEKDGDYINACYIHGFSKPKAYIASQGPVNDIFNDFWRMVWQTNCGKIVMLTNLIEEGKMKCNQYWPTSGTQTYASVVVTMKTTETFANFVIRTLVVSKGEEQRQVTQFHFTAWPDKDVPYFCSAFVHFRSKVNAAKTSCDGPLVVHCSAGIGRTGTFIAVDYLVDQAEVHGYVNLPGCVESLRQQRVNMVQTKEQYVFVHLALVEILTMKTSTVSTAQFEGVYQELLHVDDTKTKRQIDVEFETLWGMLHFADDKQINDAKASGSKSQNRYSNTTPFRDYMPSLSQPGRHLFGEFINAAFLPMFKEDNALIITQSPLDTTATEFWNMVLHQGVHAIVMMNHLTELNETEKYWPEFGERKTYEEHILIDNKNVETIGGHTVVTLALTAGEEERELKLIQFEKWSKGQPVPEDPGHILSALELMEGIQRQTGNHPVIVHCMDGVEKSGLFCVMAAVLDRVKVEHEVAISQVIQEMRNRRQNVIPTVEQFQFCHEVVLAFLKQYETYSNFAFQL